MVIGGLYIFHLWSFPFVYWTMALVIFSTRKRMCIVAKAFVFQNISAKCTNNIYRNNIGSGLYLKLY